MVTTKQTQGMPPYVAALGLQASPFPVTPDETQYFFTPKTEELYHELLHFIETCRGFMLVTGDIGLGKTTLLRRVMAGLDPARYNTALILTSFLDQAELLEAITRDFGVPLPPDARRLDHLVALNAFLLQESAAGKINVLLIDDAQALDAQALDVVRQLSNLETANQKLIQVVLMGQPEILDTLAQHGLRQVRSRFALHRSLAPLSEDELAAYLAHRLTRAGNPLAVRLTGDALQTLYRLTGGYPRRVHHLMDRCMYAVMTRPTREIDGTLVRLAWDDLDALHRKDGGTAALLRARAHEAFMHIKQNWGKRIAIGAGLLAFGAFSFWLGRPSAPRAGVTTAEAASTIAEAPPAAAPLASAKNSAGAAPPAGKQAAKASAAQLKAAAAAKATPPALKPPAAPAPAPVRLAALAAPPLPKPATPGAAPKPAVPASAAPALGAPSLAMAAGPVLKPVPAPPHWQADMASLPGLAALGWPEAGDFATIATVLATQARPAGWTLLPVNAPFPPACASRPIWTVKDAQGRRWQFTFIESALPMQPLEIGPNYPSVKEAQKRLAASGFMQPAEVDGFLGPLMVGALVRFQGANRLERTGQFNAGTAYRLSCIAAAPEGGRG